MAVWNPIEMKMKCTYKPCGLTLIKTFFNAKSVNYDTEFCPKCKLFTLKPETIAFNEYFPQNQIEGQ